MRVTVRVYASSRICGTDHFREFTKMENTKHIGYREYYIYNVEMLNLSFCGNIFRQLLGGVAPFAYLCPWLKMVVVSTLGSDSISLGTLARAFFMPLRGSHILFFFIRDIDDIMTAAFP